MAKLTDKLVARWHLQAGPLIQREQELIDQIAARKKTDLNKTPGLVSMFVNVLDTNSVSCMECRLDVVRSKQVQLARAFTLRVIKQSAGSDGKMNKLYHEYKVRRQVEVPGWPLSFSPEEHRKDDLLRFFLLQRIEIIDEQKQVLDQIFAFYKHDNSMPEPYFPENDPDSYLNNWDHPLLK